tara:strand:- start:1360 stop:1938 length:579 start_codon:yes stop_codon:yes gene_type:complete
MQSPFCFIVKPYNDRRYDNIKYYGDKKFFTSTSEEDHTVSTRFAIVINTPINYNGNIKKGDTLVVHHNVFKYYNDIYGRQKSGRSWLIDDLFLVDDFQFYMYKQDNKWHSHDKYCFVKPIPIEKKYIDVSEEEEPLWGILKYGNKQLEKLNIYPGDRISFQPNSEYEFNIDDEKLYRMYTSNITLKNGHKSN